MLIMSYIGDQVWLMTSRHTLPDLSVVSKLYQSPLYPVFDGSERYVQFIDIGVKYPINEAYAGAFIRILVW